MPNPIPVLEPEIAPLNQQNSQGQNVYIVNLPQSQAIAGNEFQTTTLEDLQEKLAFYQSKVLETTNLINQIT